MRYFYIDDCIQKRKSMIGEIKIQSEKEVLNIDLYNEIVKSFGPSFFIDLGKSKSPIDPYALQEIKQKFLQGRFGLKNTPSLDKKFNHVFELFLQSKIRAELGLPYFYYLLVVHFDLPEHFLKMAKTDENDYPQQMIDFGKTFIEKQVDIDADIHKVTNENFFSLLL